MHKKANIFGHLIGRATWMPFGPLNQVAPLLVLKHRERSAMGGATIWHLLYPITKEP